MKREMNVVGLSYSVAHSGSYVCVLSETRGIRKIPVIIRPGEANSIALHSNRENKTRPLIHEVIKEICESRQLDCREVYIYRIHEGIFLTRIVLSDGFDELTFEVSVGDGIALSLFFSCPVLVDEEVLTNCGIEMDEDGEPIADMEGPRSPVLTLDDLEELLQGALQEEDYEMAAHYRDEITKRSEKK
jgi:bifunctional DNase/RNase